MQSQRSSTPVLELPEPALPRAKERVVVAQKSRQLISKKFFIPAGGFRPPPKLSTPSSSNTSPAPTPSRTVVGSFTPKSVLTQH